MNKFDSIGGMLLLSYPAIETFVISNFEKDMINFDKRFDFENQKLKSYIGSKKYDDHKISIDTLTNAFIEMIRSLKKIDIQQINLDDLKECNSKVFDYELKNSKRYISICFSSNTSSTCKNVYNNSCDCRWTIYGANFV